MYIESILSILQCKCHRIEYICKCHLSINIQQSIDFSNHSSGTLNSIRRHPQWMQWMHPLYANSLTARCTLHVARCTLHTQLSRCIHRNRIAAHNLDRRQLCSSNEPRPMANCVTGLASWRRRTATCNVPRIVRLATQHSLCLCVCVGQWPDPFNKSVATLTRQGLSRPSSCPRD